MKKILTIFIVILIAISGLLISEQKVKEDQQWPEMINVRIEGQTKTSSRVAIETTDEIKFHVFKVSNPPRLVIEMVNAVHNWAKKEVSVSGNLITRIRSGQYKDKPVKMVRVVVDMAVDDYYHEEVTTKNEITISLSLTKEGVRKQAERKKKVRKSLKKRLKIDPNIPTEEHEEKIDEILSERQKRERELKQRIRKIEKVKPLLPDEAPDRKVSGTLVTSLSSEIVNFNFKDADIIEVLRAFAIKLNKNMIPAPGVSGKISLRLKEVPFDEAFGMLLDRMDLVAIQKSPNVIEIMKKGDMPTERVTFYLTNRNAGDIKTTLDGLLTAEEKTGTTISIDDASNSLIVTATAEVLNKIELLINQLDIKSPQIKIKVRLIEIQVGDDVSYGVSWIGSVPFGDRKYGPRFGKDAGIYGATWDEGTHEMDIAKFNVYPTDGYLGISTIMDDFDLHATLNFIAANTESKTISEPTIITENNKSANIHVGKNIPVETSEVTETGTTQIVTFIPEGVDLNVTPTVSPGSKQISLVIDISVTELIGFRADNPMTTDRSAKTQVTIESGKTIVIGGLIKETVTESDSGIPILKDIPVIGYLFKNKRTIKDRSELLIFLTPEILID